MNIRNRLDYRHGLVGVFVMGLMLGFGAGVNTSIGSASGGVIELEEADYPFEGVETGISDGIDANNSTFKVDGEPYLGNGETRMIAYEDYECPFCSRYHSGAFPQIVENEVRSGEVTYYMKNYPLRSIHPFSMEAAIASECALNQDAEAFWIFTEGFFDQQKQMKQAYKTGNFDESMMKWAEQTGLDVEKFEKCYSNEEEKDEVIQDLREGGRLGTPTIFVGEQKLSGAQPYRLFKSAIDSAE